MPPKNNLLGMMMGNISGRYGSSAEDIQNLMNRISFHESKGMPGAVQSSNVYDEEGNVIGTKEGPGRGLYQYELGTGGGSGAGRTAMNRLYASLGGNLLEGVRPENMPEFMNQYFKPNKWGHLQPSGDVDASKLTPEQQQMMFLGNAMQSGADFSPEALQDTSKWWSKHHWAGKEEDRPTKEASFRSDMNVYPMQGGGMVGSTDTVPAMLTPGEVVLNEGQQQRLGAMTGVPSGALFNAAGVPGYQDGGMVPEFEVAEPVSTAHNAMDMLMMQNEMDKISQEESRMSSLYAMHGSIRNPVPRIEGPGGLGMLDWVGGPLKGMGMLASPKTVSRMIKDLVFKSKGIESEYAAGKKILRSTQDLSRNYWGDPKVAGEMNKLRDTHNTNASLIEALRNWQRLNKKAVKK